MVKKSPGRVRRAKVMDEEEHDAYFITPSVARELRASASAEMDDDVYEMSIDRYGLYVGDGGIRGSWTLYPWHRVLWMEVAE